MTKIHVIKDIKKPRLNVTIRILAQRKVSTTNS